MVYEMFALTREHNFNCILNVRKVLASHSHCFSSQVYIGLNMEDKFCLLFNNLIYCLVLKDDQDPLEIPVQYCKNHNENNQVASTSN